MSCKKKSQWTEYQHLTLYIAYIETTRQSSAVCWSQSYLWMLSAMIVYKWKLNPFLKWIELYSMSHMSECQLHLFFLLASAFALSKPEAFSSRTSHSSVCLNYVRISHAFMMKSIWLPFVPELFYYFAQVGDRTTCFIENRCHILPLVSIEGQLPWKYRSSCRFRTFTCVIYWQKMTDNGK